jgi:hypothetical protein
MLDYITGHPELWRKTKVSLPPTAKTLKLVEEILTGMLRSAASCNEASLEQACKHILDMTLEEKETFLKSRRSKGDTGAACPA